MAVQPVMTDYAFHGFQAPVPMFLDAGNAHRTTNLTGPALYSMLAYGDSYGTRFTVDQEIEIEQAGTLNSLRFITKNLLAIDTDARCSIDWDMQDLIIPLARPIEVAAGDVIRIRFQYHAGDSLLALADAIDRDEPPATT